MWLQQTKLSFTCVNWCFFIAQQKYIEFILFERSIVVFHPVFIMNFDRTVDFLCWLVILLCEFFVYLFHLIGTFSIYHFSYVKKNRSLEQLDDTSNSLKKNLHRNGSAKKESSSVSPVSFIFSLLIVHLNVCLNGKHVRIWEYVYAKLIKFLIYYSLWWTVYIISRKMM